MTPRGTFRSFQIDKELTVSIVVASFVAAMTGGAITFARTLKSSSVLYALATSLIEVLVTWAVLGLCGGAVVLLFAAIVGADTVRDFLARPEKWIREVWTGSKPGRETAVGEIFGKLAEQLMFFSLIFGGAYAVFERFHEAVRMSLLIAALGLLAAPIAVFAGRLLSGRVFVPIAKSLAHRTRLLGPAAILLMGAAPVGVMLYGVIRADEIFGDIDPAPVALILVFVVSLAGASALPRRLGRLLPGPFWLVACALGLFTASIFVAGTASQIRAPLTRGGVIGPETLDVLRAGLDMDGDGFAWFLGGDCHPFDAKAGPFASEIPGNGYDENCDGLDRSFGVEDYTDPLKVIAPAPRRLIKPKGNILFVVIDAAQARHLKLYGYKRDTMPALGRFARTATVFENSFAVGNHTSIAMPALLTGHFPSYFSGILARNWNSFKVPDKANSIQKRLKKTGYQPIMYAGHRLGGFLRGFHIGIKVGKERIQAKSLGAKALARLKALGPRPEKPVLFFVHFIDAHHPYRAGSNPYRFGKRKVDRYDAELAYVDDHLEPILALMQEKEYADWLVVVTSDHGEGFYEHGTRYHGKNLYDEEVRVPLIVRAPGARPGRVSIPASHLDIVPTLVEWTGGKPDSALNGQSLLPLLGDKKLAPGARRVVFGECFRTGDIYGVFDGRFTVLYGQRENRFEIYDGSTDPLQKKNIYVPGKNPLLEGLLKNHVRESRERIRRHEERRNKRKGKAAPSGK